MSDMNGTPGPDDEHSHEGHGHGHLHAFAIPLDAAVNAMDRSQQSAEVWSVRISNFLDGLSVDQILVLRRMLNMDSNSAWNMYWDGQLAAMLRLVHHVDEETGAPDPRLTPTTEEP